MKRARSIVVILLCLLPTVARADEGAPRCPAPRAAVVRVQAALDPTSLGPELLAELMARQPWDAYEGELARRLEVGSTGAGFFVNARGDLITNAHVVLGGVRYRGLHLTWSQWDSMRTVLTAVLDIWVTVGDGEQERSYAAEPVVIAEDLDLAILRVVRPPGDETEFTPLPITSSDHLTVGQKVWALGFPAQEYRATSGEILSLIRGAEVHEAMQIVRHRDPKTGEETVTVRGTTPGPIMRLQHTAPTGYGSSGGPIVDDRGRVVAVAYAVVSDGKVPEENIGLSGLNLGIASSAVKTFLTRNAVSFTEARR